MSYLDRRLKDGQLIAFGQTNMHLKNGRVISLLQADRCLKLAGISGEIRSIADELAIAGSSLGHAELLVKILSGLGPDYKEISAAICSQDTSINFEMFDKLSAHEITKHDTAKYTTDLLQKFDMMESKRDTTPLSATTPLTSHDGSTTADATKYRQLIGALQYLSFTRLDLSYAVNRLSQFMHCPTKLHWQSAKRVMRYLKSKYHMVFYFIYNLL
ncbi:hypothetical protein GH714_017749 [Hevea brasiliensis]|uniref:Reverse transcriptase Ty1/copia-type domain-containing protein n=1 Tax=Hevea brasiliensis TaxID=3981 RepID=A0A6A6M9Z6_HEVBR|nr:hypothetical protein GH714_017749 [Hevea brasiliensis]